MVSLRFREVSFAFDGSDPILRSASFQLERRIVGVVGENGAGKTTLLRLIAGELRPDEGRIQLSPARATLHLCRQVSRETTPRSSGERRKDDLGVALRAGADVLLIDEPTNHLDAQGRAELARALRGRRELTLLVSHDRSFLDEVCDATLRLEGGRVTLLELPYSAARAAWEAEERAASLLREQRRAAAERAERKLVASREEHRRSDAMKSAGRRMKDRHDSDARGIGAGFRAERAERRLGRRVGALASEAEQARARVPVYEGRRSLGRSVVVRHVLAPKDRLVSLRASALEAGGRVVLRDLDVTVLRDSRVHLAGVNGAGKSTLLRALMATLPGDRVLFLPQEQDESSVRALVSEVTALPRERRGHALGIYAALGGSADRVLVGGAPSPGEAKKLAIACALERDVWALLLDEPENHLDLPSIERLEAALSAFPGAIVLTSHDAHFAERVARERWTIEGGAVKRGDLSVQPATRALR